MPRGPIVPPAVQHCAGAVLVCLAVSVVSIPALLEYINAFGSISGYTINWGKSGFMYLTDQLTDDFLTSQPFKVMKECFTSLGFKLTKNPKHHFKFNFVESIEKLEANIEFWRILPLSMIGWVNAIKMVSLPRFLYLFQNLSIYLNASFFMKLDSIILPFVWGYKSHRISKAHLQKSFKNGGLALPVLKHYSWAANARALSYWKEGNAIAYRILCGYSWRLLRSICHHSLPFCFLIPPQ